MSRKEPNPKVDEYILKGCERCEYFNTPNCKVNRWRDVLIELRQILLKSNLKEELKWKQPCYTYEGKNIVILGALKDYVALGFFKGALLRDSKGVLIAPGENSQSARQIRFTSIKEVRKLKTKIENFINEAIDVEKSGKKIESKFEINIPP